MYRRPCAEPPRPCAPYRRARFSSTIWQFLLCKPKKIRAQARKPTSQGRPGALRARATGPLPASPKDPDLPPRTRAGGFSSRSVTTTPADPVVAKPHFPWTKIVISSDEKRRSSRRLPGPFAAEQPTDASYLSRVVRCAPASDEAPRGPNWQGTNRRTRRPKFHDERPATPRCLLALPTEASSFP